MCVCVCLEWWGGQGYSGHAAGSLYLEESVLNVRKHDVDDLLLLGHEAYSVGVGFDRPDGLAATGIGPHRDIRKARYSALLEPK